MLIIKTLNASECCLSGPTWETPPKIYPVNQRFILLTSGISNIRS